MTPDEVQDLIQSGLEGATVQVEGDGAHFQAVVIWEQFAGKTSVQRQRMVYSVINEWIQDGRLHAISLKTHTELK